MLKFKVVCAASTHDPKDNPEQGEWISIHAYKPVIERVLNMNGFVYSIDVKCVFGCDPKYLTIVKVD